MIKDSPAKVTTTGTLTIKFYTVDNIEIKYSAEQEQFTERLRYEIVDHEVVLQRLYSFVENPLVPTVSTYKIGLSKTEAGDLRIRLAGDKTIFGENEGTAVLNNFP